MNELGAVLVVCPGAPYPAMSGSALRTWQTISLAARTRKVGVLSLGTAAAVDSVPGVALWRHVTVEAGKPAEAGFPILSDLAALAALESTFDELDAALQPSVVVFSNFWPERPPRRLSSHPRRTILDLHNAYAAYVLQTGRDATAAAELEARAARSVDAVWACSEHDAEALRQTCAPTPVVVIPNGIDIAAYAGIRRAQPRANRRQSFTLLFVGSYWYEPNRVAADLLIENIFPAVRAAFPAARLMLVGAAPSARMVAAAAAGNGIAVTGQVPDVRPYLEFADVVVAPLLHGSGTRLKLLEAFAARRAVVATPKAAEGLAVRDGDEVLLREPAGFAKGLIELGRAPEHGRSLADQAYLLAERLYGWDALEPQVAAALGPPGRQM